MVTTLATVFTTIFDREYLLDKLYKFANRLREAFGNEFDSLITRPSATTRAEAAGQQTLGFEG